MNTETDLNTMTTDDQTTGHDDQPPTGRDADHAHEGERRVGHEESPRFSQCLSVGSLRVSEADAARLRADLDAANAEVGRWRTLFGDVERGLKVIEQRDAANRTVVEQAATIEAAWDEGWRVGASGRNMPNPYRAVLPPVDGEKR